ncbi:MAG: YihA family ribosome biogenesis GTP-binding protein [Rhodocyclaceae bacterium]|jgi:GTP-binding protein|nr:YihA family ribosome biogenesis GTP-binding protein [Rhodocyclaceae bacterium]
MTPSLFRHARFEISVADPQSLPQAGGAEIAFAGRSNAGKSSAINALAGHTRLAFVSKTPGRTQLINLFRLKCGAALVDLPGYGYAEVPEAVRRQWQGLLEHYLTRREALAGLVLIMDARRPFTDLDRQMVEWFGRTGKPIHCLLTKADKLTRQEQMKALAAACRLASAEFPGVPITLQLFSSLKKSGIEEAEQVIDAWLGQAEGKKEKGPSAKGEKAESPNASTSVEAPAQGGKAGDGSSPSML